ncbi:hypothetical protein [Nocardia alni]|uniref:hypothetical protein n=1 Tax=Nocardia alni TaxID=2815723 RepID=UPI001C24229B|nr:hypothetical protein [Nocardia alni]
MPESPASPSAAAPHRSPRRTPNIALPLALGLFTIGLLAIVAIFLTPILSDAKPGLWLYLVAMVATPAGLLLAIGFTLWSGRRVR